MAKLSANGDTERARWRHPTTGAELVLTNKGRLLQKQRGGTFTIVARGFLNDLGIRSAQAMAFEREMDRVPWR